MHMKQRTKYLLLSFTCLLFLFLISVIKTQAKTKGCSLTIEVNNLRNSNGSVVFALYNREDAFPDEHYKKCVKKITGSIINGSSTVTFENLIPAKYAVSILHDENNDGKIKKGFILPVEGIGFPNYKSIGLGNKPKFGKASFYVAGNSKINIKIIYM